MPVTVRRLTSILLALMTSLVASAGSGRAQTPAFDANGFADMHPMYPGAPQEYVDPLSGDVNIVTTDLVLTGNAGFTLPITRWYSSQIFPLIRIGDHTVEKDQFAGIGWRLHFGRVLQADSTTPGQTVIELPLGIGGPLWRTARFSEGWMTKGFALYNRSNHTLKLPNGRVYTFGIFHNGSETGQTRYVTEIKDQFGNRVTFEYFTDSLGIQGVKKITQYLTATETRVVDFTINTAVGKSLATMTYNGQTWRYEQTSAWSSIHTVLRRVWYPGNTSATADWEYSYGGHASVELTRIRYPSGGTVSYTYAEIARVAQNYGMNYRVVTSRATAGPSIAAGTWTIAYDQGTSKDWTFVTGPITTHKYRYWGVGNGSDYSAWIKGALRDYRLEAGGVLLQRTVNTYLQSEKVSSDPVPPNDAPAFWGDGAVWNALLETSTTTRGSNSWKRTYTYRWGNNTYNDLNQAVSILEEGERTRTITRAFHFNSFTPWLPGRFSWEKVAVGGQTVTVSDPNYDSLGFTTSANVNGVTSTFTRLANGNVATATDARGNQTSFQYSKGTVSRIETPELLTTRTINADGTIASETVGSLTTSYTYDALGRVTRIRPPGVGTLSAETQISYTGSSWPFQVIRTTRGSLTSEVWLDGFGRERLTIGPDGVRKSVTRDAEGRVTFASYPHTSTASVPGTTFTYDGLGRTLTATETDGSVTRYAYSGDDLTVTDAENRATTYTYHSSGAPGAGVLASVTDAAGNTTTYGYNAFDTLTRVSVPGVPDRTWTYEALKKDCLTSDTQPESGTTTYQRDAVCNATQITDAEGQVFTLTYDGNNRLTDRNAPGSESDLSITYDGMGRVTAQEIPSSRTTYTFDGAGRLASRTDTYTGITWQSEYAYDTLDRLTALTYPSGRVVGYSYDSGGRPDGVTQQGQVFADAFSYTDAGQLEAFRTGAVVQALDYDNRLRVRRLTAGNELDLTYTYDRTSNVLGIADARPGQDQTFDYDALSRLTDATGPWGQLSWTYDAAGNRLTESGTAGSTTYTYSASTERLLSTAGAMSESFSYDATGRLTADGRGTYAYTATSRLATATTPAGAATYAYTAEDLRIATVMNGNPPTYTIRGAGQEVLHEQGTIVKTSGPPSERNQPWTRELIYVAGRLVGAVRDDTAVEYYATDALGSMRVVFDATGSAIGQSDYLPFGQALNPSGTLPAQRFTGQERDEEGGLDYFNARMMMPRAGRFTAVDAVFLGPTHPQDWNRYTYGRNNPLLFTDPSGNTVCQQGTAEQKWCPAVQGPILDPSAFDKYFDPDQYGYRGGEELAAAEQRYEERLNEAWDESRHNEYFTASALAQNGKCETTYCEQVVGKPSPADIEVNKLAMEIARKSRYVTEARTILEFYGLSAVGGLGVYGGLTGREIVIAGVRVAPFGNRTGHPIGRFPHYHRRLPPRPGETKPPPGGGIGRHRPWEPPPPGEPWYKRF